MRHFIAMNGSHGCLPDACYALRTHKDAVETLVESLELTRSQARELQRTDIVECKPSQGADYCEIIPCDCSTPWNHDENSTQEDWQLTRSRALKALRKMFDCRECYHVRFRRAPIKIAQIHGTWHYVQNVYGPEQSCTRFPGFAVRYSCKWLERSL